jgi:hypothetical protein
MIDQESEFILNEGTKENLLYLQSPYTIIVKNAI